MSKKHGSMAGCFECGTLGHFVADCPKRKAYYLKGNGGGMNDSGGPFKSNDYKYHPRKASRIKGFQGVVKDFQKETKHQEKELMAKVEE